MKLMRIPLTNFEKNWSCSERNTFDRVIILALTVIKKLLKTEKEWK